MRGVSRCARERLTNLGDGDQNWDDDVKNKC